MKIELKYKNVKAYKSALTEKKSWNQKTSDKFKGNNFQSFATVMIRSYEYTGHQHSVLVL